LSAGGPSSPDAASAAVFARAESSLQSMGSAARQHQKGGLKGILGIVRIVQAAMANSEDHRAGPAERQTRTHRLAKRNAPVAPHRWQSPRSQRTAEFKELAIWFQANEVRLYPLSALSYSLDVGAGRMLLQGTQRIGTCRAACSWPGSR
jgi:hypothetical protein